jgi:hypothetical protein
VLRRGDGGKLAMAACSLQHVLVEERTARGRIAAPGRFSRLEKYRVRYSRSRRGLLVHHDQVLAVVRNDSLKRRCNSWPANDILDELSVCNPWLDNADRVRLLESAGSEREERQ